EAQSLSPLHAWVRAHFGHVAPPQSVSVSVPSLRLSAHWFSTQVLVRASQALVEQSESFTQRQTPPLEQSLLVQSEFTEHPLPARQAGQTPPPQSVSVSAPSFWWSTHWLVAQRLLFASQASFGQSAALRQGQVPPPQSMSDSAPSFLWSEHWSATQRVVFASQALVSGQSVSLRQWQTPLTQSLLAQSEFFVHASPTGQAGQTPPPQSTSVSSPSLWLSAHWFVTQALLFVSQASEAQSVSVRQRQTFPVQVLLVQSAFCEHPSPARQAGQTPPPQSVSVSSPSCWWSEH